MKYRFALTRALRARRARPPEVFSCSAAARAACVSTWLGEISIKHGRDRVCTMFATTIIAQLFSHRETFPENLPDRLSDYHWSTLFVWHSYATYAVSIKNLIEEVSWNRLSGRFFTVKKGRGPLSNSKRSETAARDVNPKKIVRGNIPSTAMNGIRSTFLASPVSKSRWWSANNEKLR